MGRCCYDSCHLMNGSEVKRDDTWWSLVGQSLRRTREKRSAAKRGDIFGHKVILRLFSSCLDSCSFILSTKSDKRDDDEFYCTVM